MKEKIVKVEVRQVYGNTYYHPANEAAKLFANIAGTKTIAAMHMKYIRSLGFKVEPFSKAVNDLQEQANADVQERTIATP